MNEWMRERTNEQVKKSYVQCELLRIFITSEQAFSISAWARTFVRPRAAKYEVSSNVSPRKVCKGFSISHKCQTPVKLSSTRPISSPRAEERASCLTIIRVCLRVTIFRTLWVRKCCSPTRPKQTVFGFVNWLSILDTRNGISIENVTVTRAFQAFKRYIEISIVRTPLGKTKKLVWINRRLTKWGGGEISAFQRGRETS